MPSSSTSSGATSTVASIDEGAADVTPRVHVATPVSGPHEATNPAPPRGRIVRALRAIDRVLAWPLLALIFVYRKLISPALPPACRFYPSCSAYAHEALVRHGLSYGAPLMAWRLCRCHPLSRGGFDPVPGSPGSTGSEPVEDREGN